MEDYLVIVFESLRKDVIVKASSYEEARKKALAAYKAGKFKMTMDDIVSDLTDSEVFTLVEALDYKEIDAETMPSVIKLDE